MALEEWVKRKLQIGGYFRVRGEVDAHIKASNFSTIIIGLAIGTGVFINIAAAAFFFLLSTSFSGSSIIGSGPSTVVLIVSLVIALSFLRGLLYFLKAGPPSYPQFHVSFTLGELRRQLVLTLEEVNDEEKASVNLDDFKLVGADNFDSFRKCFFERFVFRLYGIFDEVDDYASVSTNSDLESATQSLIIRSGDIRIRFSINILPIMQLSSDAVISPEEVVEDLFFTFEFYVLDPESEGAKDFLVTFPSAFMKIILTSSDEVRQCLQK